MTKSLLLAVAVVAAAATACKTSDNGSAVKDAPAASAPTGALALPSDAVMTGFTTYCAGGCHDDAYGSADKNVAWNSVLNGTDGSNPQHAKIVAQRLCWEKLTTTAQKKQRMPKDTSLQAQMTGQAGLRAQMMAATDPTNSNNCPSFVAAAPSAPAATDAAPAPAPAPAPAAAPTDAAGAVDPGAAQ